MRPKPLVLIVDDEEFFLEIASVKLREGGFETVLAIGVKDALEKTERLLPDFVLSDVYMPPGPSGWELAIELRRNPKTRNIKFAFFTSLRDPWAELRRDRADVAAELGSVSFFSKVEDTDRLGEKVARLLQDK